MTPQNDKPNFLDRGTIAAFVIIMAFWVLWSSYMDKKPTNQITTENPAVATSTPVINSGDANLPTQAPPATVGDTKNPISLGTSAASSDETFQSFSNENWSFEISSKGMGLRRVDVKTYTDRSGQPIILGDVTGPLSFSTYMLESGKPIDFVIQKLSDDTFVGRATVDGVQVEKTMKIDPRNYSVTTEVKALGAIGSIKGFSIYLNDVIPETQKSSMFSPSYDRQDWYVAHDDTKTRAIITKEKPVSVDAHNVAIAALSSHYFTLAISDHSDLMPSFESKIQPMANYAIGRLVYKPVNPVDNFSMKYTLFAGPKSFDILSSVDEKLTTVIDYGTFAVIAKPILRLLKSLFSILGNWGWAILILTVIVRLLVLPFNVYSFKSMKVMQKIQPEMNRIREKYKDATAENKLQMNQEIMGLMKTHKANPLGGCLPMLVQLPVFFALYQVLGQSIELYKAPFIFWIYDLSTKDPFFVLPVLMGITMFVQQKITPSTMDPQQAKIMMWMPVIFSFFMVSLPSGLTLYIFVSTLFGIIQQFVFMREKGSAGLTKPAKA
jgi:YidC/Oxa1 family membrane protein insertase